MNASIATSLTLQQGPHVKNSINNIQPDKSGSNTIDALDRSPDDVRIKHHHDNQSQPVYFTSNLNEGFASVEEITCVITPQKPDTNAQDIQQLGDPNIHQESLTGDAVGYGHQMGNTHDIILEIESSTESNEGSDDEKNKELLIATPLQQVLTSTEPLGSPLMFSDSIDILEPQIGRDVSSIEFTDTLREGDSNESLYNIISDDSSNDVGILQHLPDFELDLDTESDTSRSSFAEGNIPNLKALGVDMSKKTFSPAQFQRSFSVPATRANTSPYHRDLSTPSVSSRSSVRVDKESAGSSGKDESDRKIHFCTTSTQSAIMEKIKFRPTTIDVSDVDDFSKKYDLKQSSNKTTELINDSDKASHSSNGKDDLVESEFESAFEASVRESSMLPILKQELKYKIQVNRMKRGKPEVVLQSEQPKEYKLRPEEIKKRAERLRQNRLSAHKSRMKANQYKHNLEMKIKDEMNKTTKLRQEIKKLQAFKGLLRRELDDHMEVCSRRSRTNSV